MLTSGVFRVMHMMQTASLRNQLILLMCLKECPKFHFIPEVLTERLAVSHTCENSHCASLLEERQTTGGSAEGSVRLFDDSASVPRFMAALLTANKPIPCSISLLTSDDKTLPLASFGKRSAIPTKLHSLLPKTSHTCDLLPPIQRIGYRQFFVV